MIDNNKFLDDAKNLTTINPDWLRYFVIYAEIGNTKSTAEYLNISPQALSKAISGIESILKTELIKRGKYFKGLTEKGELFYNKAKIILQQMHDLNKSLTEMQGNEYPTINLGYINLWSAHSISKIISKFSKQYSDLKINIFSMTNLEIEKWLSLGELDIGLLCGEPQKKELNYLNIGKSEYIIVSSNPEKKDFRELEYIVARSFNHKINSWLEEYHCTSKIGTDSIEMGIQLCLKGVGAICTPELLVDELIEKKQLFVVAKPPQSHFANIFITWNKNISLNNLMSSFITEFKNDFILKESI